MFLIIHNPLSNNRKSKKNTNKVVRFFRRHHIPFILRSSLKIENLDEYLASNASIEHILHLGGDGSINYLINSVDITEIKQPIYLSKSGSGNDFLRSLKQLGTGNITLSTAHTNVKDTLFINGCGIGVDASVCHYVNNDKRKNKLSYFKNVFKAVSAFKRIEIDLKVDGKDYHYKDAYFVSIQNGKYFGGGMKVAPNADITDDQYEVCVAFNLNAFLLQLLFLTIYSGSHVHLKKRVAMHRGKNISVKVSSPCYFQADGEVLADVKELTVEKAKSRNLIAFQKNTIKAEFSQKK
ncbi:MAG: diacylglycerol kinase family protein [Candidatus Izemoplasmatales bacterium]|nr:diacylglycerol kinase family protein [Candidatus Izemoplasmatales bacterium]MDD4987420.1 diacylglycerol kinase family protein [Candidatus Izemoplasmatales bacterium]MDD5601389.1 diacylglycerol kinase family protein [Candidatus Izemoplasmatales bacterium]